MPPPPSSSSMIRLAKALSALRFTNPFLFEGRRGYPFKHRIFPDRHFMDRALMVAIFRNAASLQRALRFSTCGCSPAETVQRTQLRRAFDQIVHALPMKRQGPTEQEPPAIVWFLKPPISVVTCGLLPCRRSHRQPPHRGSAYVSNDMVLFCIQKNNDNTGREICGAGCAWHTK